MNALLVAADPVLRESLSALSNTVLIRRYAQFAAEEYVHKA
jgi:hypothetical protein